MQGSSGEEQTHYYEDHYQADMMASSEPTYPPAVLASRNRFCRLCLKRSESFLLPLVAKMEHVTVMEMLLMVTGVELAANALFPTKICSNCMTKLDFAYNVRQEFLNSTELLLKMAVEGKLVEYYAQFDPVVGSYTDEVLKQSRNVLESSTTTTMTDQGVDQMEVKVVNDTGGIRMEVLSEEVVEEGSEDQKIEVLEFEEYECLDEELDGSTMPEELVAECISTTNIKSEELDDAQDPKNPTVAQSSNQTIKVKNEKFVYSWKELAKPKQRKKKVRPENPLNGIDRKATANAEMLAQFPQTTCYICDTAHSSLEERDEHLNVHIGMVPHRCETCSTEEEPVLSKSVITLNRHRLMHRLPYKCPKCFRRFISSGSQYTHIWSMHMTGSEGLTCDYCGKTFNQKRSYQAHVRRHRYKANGKYRCDVCGDTCGSSLLLTRHKRKHTGERNFSCPYCSKRFSRACNLLTHKRIHTNERCHLCDDCGRAFRDSVTLRKHQERFHMAREPSALKRNPFIITPDGRKMFQCKKEGCSYETFSSTSISRHKARHSKRYVCADCGKRFAEPNLVRRHQAAMHNADKKKRGKNDGNESLQIEGNQEGVKCTEADDVPTKQNESGQEV
ncbi:zinc finger protein 678-like [Aedes albopictus]|uniref:C2h2-type zn-finger protein n=1 Tax=Aedes albopictus TaxID=7160 RepID=A0ABM1YXG2_AEDAL